MSRTPLVLAAMFLGSLLLVAAWAGTFTLIRAALAPIAAGQASEQK